MYKFIYCINEVKLKAKSAETLPRVLVYQCNYGATDNSLIYYYVLVQNSIHELNKTKLLYISTMYISLLKV